ncbi:indolepyruvate ferredoxin oxidoreductase alpha and beta subunits-like protein [Methanolacinia petrolearia DSM 11571]|uniref:Indolepyruvate ferredoxin oxidoreductase alpha and beta subunits-like protein n=1 Tax=Methanolacinia petrolearia (strain DSM 11571 / OCM 486 / SEBR 4847) TaxID=679926 RepID=E1REI8_METP4|nr:thiamine pyrophosphate-dependent enzyme [Methanolacinia petrolearia]ADN37231.1 indolepyruvate ferredoxin oxidoreductase alpha and beta subunits-like protein [Methanolacinia petrolearia DSM 11571]
MAMKTMTGEDLIAASVAVSADMVYTVPGYPVTSLGDKTGAEFVINEKTALEYAIGDSLAGKRSVVIVKNAGMNALADPLVITTTQGLKKGVLVIAGDDTEAKGSQNRQDSRYYAEVAEVPLIEPDEKSLHCAVEFGLSASEKYSRIAILRVTPRILDVEVKGIVVPAERGDGSGSLADPALTMKGRSQNADNITRKMFANSKSPVIYPPAIHPDRDRKPDETGRQFIADHRTATPPPFTKEPETMASRGFSRGLCPNCPYRPLFDTIAASGRETICDTGCSLLAKNPPYNFGIANYGLGSSVAVAAKSTGLALLGDYAVLHSGLNSLIDIWQKSLPILCVVLVNRRAAMTGMKAVADIAPYLGWAKPVRLDCGGGSMEIIAEKLGEKREKPEIILVYGQCPEGESHEAVKC